MGVFGKKLLCNQVEPLMTYFEDMTFFAAAAACLEVRFAAEWSNMIGLH